MDEQRRWTCPGELRDYGDMPLVVNIDETSDANRNFRTALWTGKYLQVTLMSIPVGGDIGVEIHPDTDQFIRVESGCGVALTGCSCSELNHRQTINRHSAVIIPAGTWHNLVNTGDCPLKLYSIYAPPHHPFGTVHRTKADAT